MQRSVQDRVAANTVEQPKFGNKAATAELIRGHATTAYRVAYAILQNHADAQDVVQDAFIRAFQNLTQIRDEKAFAPWLGRIVANQAHDLLRRKGLQRRLSEQLAATTTTAPGQPEPQEEVSRQDTASLVRRAVDQLPNQQRAAILLYYGGEMTTDEVAVMLGKPSGTVRRLLSDAYKNLRRLLKGGMRQ
jgi:RNA polymerase sigma-70 factor (ECF subfamily)